MQFSKSYVSSSLSNNSDAFITKYTKTNTYPPTDAAVSVLTLTNIIPTYAHSNSRVSLDYISAYKSDAIPGPRQAKLTPGKTKIPLPRFSNRTLQTALSA